MKFDRGRGGKNKKNVVGGKNAKIKRKLIHFFHFYQIKKYRILKIFSRRSFMEKKLGRKKNLHPGALCKVNYHLIPITFTTKLLLIKCPF